MNGIVREYTFSRLDLHDGGNYTIKLIVCNGAKICVEDESRGIIVDSSPPTPGRLTYIFGEYIPDRNSKLIGEALGLW